MKSKAGREDKADARDRDYRRDWNDHAAWSRWKESPPSLEMILFAKSKGQAAALPFLLDKCGEDSEEGGEALDAVFVIISKNPGNREILSMVPALVAGLQFPDSMFHNAMLLSAIAEANPDSDECKSCQGQIIGAMRAINEMESSLDVRITLQELALTLGSLDGPGTRDFLVTLLASKHCDLSGEFEREIVGAIQRLHR